MKSTNLNKSCMRKLTMGIYGNAVMRYGKDFCVHHSFGRIVNLIASRVKTIHYCGPLRQSDDFSLYDFVLHRKNIKVRPDGSWKNSLEGISRPIQRVQSYLSLFRECDGILVRGSPPFSWVFHVAAIVAGKPLVHWIVGNPLAVITNGHRGYGTAFERLGRVYAKSDRILLKIVSRISKAVLLTNGNELFRLFATPRTIQIVSTSITKDDFFYREDTCISTKIRILFVGFVRPEKGIEYLIRALPLISSERRVKLSIVGSWQQFSFERDRLKKIITELGLDLQVNWEGYAKFGEVLFSHMDRSDILVLPSFSEGTPRVLVEARARSLPVVATNVGGIPTSISDGHDGLLVPPKNPYALARAISEIINNSGLRRTLIKNGRENVRDLTVDHFADLVVDLLANGMRSKCQLS